MLYIRTDMNDVIATGHVMRCLSIADAASALGEQTVFITADENPTELIKSRGYTSIVLHTKWNDMESEIEALTSVIQECGTKQILIDSYQVTDKYLKAIKQQAKVFYIDDVNAFLYPADGLICYAAYCDEFQYEKHYTGRDIVLYTGTKYVPLRQVFCHMKPKSICTKAENLLILSGGTDPYNFIANLLKNMNKSLYQHIYVICGKYYANYKELCKTYENEKNIHLYSGVADIEKYMQLADVAISAGGTTLYELCAVGTPTITYSFADNQLKNVQKFSEMNVMDYAGDLRKDAVVENVLKYLTMLDADIEIRKKKAVQMQQLVDGAGAERIAKLLMH